jgi:Na+/H+-translocating membrane pyrophosphatase
LVAGLAVLGLTLSFLFLPFLYEWHMDFKEDMTIVLETLAGFFGAESIALFARVGGGIYAADGADLVVKSRLGFQRMTA